MTPAERDSQSHKVCRLCGVNQPIDEFFRHKIMKHGRRNECKSCMIQEGKAHKLTFRGKWTTARKKAAIRGLEFTVPLERYTELIMFGCYYCKKRLVGMYGTNLDRIDNSRGYTNENVIPCCPMCNRIKHTYVSVNEMLSVAKLLNSMGNPNFCYAA